MRRRGTKGEREREERQIVGNRKIGKRRDGKGGRGEDSKRELKMEKRERGKGAKGEREREREREKRNGVKSPSPHPPVWEDNLSELQYIPRYDPLQSSPWKQGSKCR